MSVSSALSSFLLCCFYPSGGHRHGHRAGAYYYSSHPTSANTLYGYQEGPLAGRRMGRSSRPLSLQVRRPLALLFSSARALFFPSVRHRQGLHVKQMAGRVYAMQVRQLWPCECDVTCPDLFSARHQYFSLKVFLRIAYMKREVR
jgi:hypothetical protein